MSGLLASSAQDDSGDESETWTQGSEVSSDAWELGADSSQGGLAKRQRRAERGATKSRLSALNELSVEVGAMVNDPDYSDIVFVCNDGVRVRASRVLLFARSAVFKSMLGSGMVESKSEQIDLPNLSSVALLPALEFLYAGDFRRHKPQGDAILEVMRAAQYLLLPKLERRAFKLLFRHIENVVQKCVERDEGLEEEAFSLFCGAVIDADMSKSTTRRTLNKIVAHMYGSDVSVICLADLTKEQMQIYVDIAPRYWVKGKCNKTFLRQFYGYLRLRLIVLWCAGRLSSEVAERLEPYLPGPQASSLISQLGNRVAPEVNLEPHFTEEPHILWQTKQHVQSIVAQCRDFLRLEDVPAQLLRQIIEPISVIPPSLLSAAYRHKALSHDMGILKWDSRMHSQEYIVRDGGSVVECKVRAANMPGWKGPGLARASRMVDPDRDTGVQQWEFIVEERCDNLQLGFIEPQLGNRKRKLDKDLRSTGWALSESGLICPLSVLSKPSPSYAGKDHLGANSRVRVCIDEKGRCSFIINGVDHGTAWMFTPSVIIPACTLSHPGRVRIQNVAV